MFDETELFIDTHMVCTRERLRTSAFAASFTLVRQKLTA